MSKNISKLMKTVLLEAVDSLRYHTTQIKQSVLESEKKIPNFKDSSVYTLCNDKIEEKNMYADIIESYIKHNFNKEDED